MGDPREPATFEDLRAVPDDVSATVIDGELLTQPRPPLPVARATTRLVSKLMGPFHRGLRGPGGWIILFEPELHLHGDILVPDIAGWRRSRMPAAPDEPAIEIAPDWACETLSPSYETIDRVRKRPIYAHERVAHLWLMAPSEKTVEAFRLEAGCWVVGGAWAGQAKVRIEPFEAVELDLGELWAD